MKVMTNIINTMRERIEKDILRYPYENAETFEMILAAYNRFCEDERDGHGYLFCIYNQNDLLFLVKNGMNAETISEIFDNANSRTSSYFFYDENHTPYKAIPSTDEVIEVLVDALDEICECVLTYVTRCAEYQSVYEKYVTDTYIEYKTAESLRDKTRLNDIKLKLGLPIDDDDIDALAELKRKLELGLV